jgi:hypothetical protein
MASRRAIGDGNQSARAAGTTDEWAHSPPTLHGLRERGEEWTTLSALPVEASFLVRVHSRPPAALRSVRCPNRISKVCLDSFVHVLHFSRFLQSTSVNVLGGRLTEDHARMAQHVSYAHSPGTYSYAFANAFDFARLSVRLVRFTLFSSK